MRFVYLRFYKAAENRLNDLGATPISHSSLKISFSLSDEKSKGTQKLAPLGISHTQRRVWIDRKRLPGGDNYIIQKIS